MTEVQIREALRELRTIERMQAAITKTRVSSDWHVVLAALDDRAKYARYALSLAAPEDVLRIEAQLNFEATIPEPITSIALPVGTRLH